MRELTLASSSTTSISTNRLPGHVRRPTPKGTTMLALSTFTVKLPELASIQRSGQNCLASWKLASLWQAIMFWQSTTV